MIHRIARLDMVENSGCNPDNAYFEPYSLAYLETLSRGKSQWKFAHGYPLCGSSW